MKKLKKIYSGEQRETEGGGLRYVLVSFLLILFALAPGRDSSALSAVQPGKKEIAWKGYQEGLAQARREGKPALIIFYSDSCSACRRYKSILRDKSVVDASAPFVMIRVNTRQYPRLSQDYQFDGRYIPRTFAVFPDGRIMHRLYPRKRYRYFIGLEPKNLLRLMEKAQAEMK